MLLGLIHGVVIVVAMVAVTPMAIVLEALDAAHEAEVAEDDAHREDDVDDHEQDEAALETRRCYGLLVATITRSVGVCNQAILCKVIWYMSYCLLNSHLVI